MLDGNQGKIVPPQVWCILIRSGYDRNCITYCLLFLLGTDSLHPFLGSHSLHWNLLTDLPFRLVTFPSASGPNGNLSIDIDIAQWRPSRPVVLEHRYLRCFSNVKCRLGTETSLSTLFCWREIGSGHGIVDICLLGKSDVPKNVFRDVGLPQRTLTPAMPSRLTLRTSYSRYM